MRPVANLYGNTRVRAQTHVYIIAANNISYSSPVPVCVSLSPPCPTMECSGVGGR